MSITNVQTVQSGLVGVLPSLAYISTTDTLATVVGAGYLNKEVANGAIFSLPCMALVSTQTTPQAAPDVSWFEVQHSGANWSLVSTAMSGPQVISDTTALAAPGTVRALTAKMIGTAAVMTSGNLVGVRGEVDYVGASGGFLYGVQGKIIPTGTLSGSSWNAAVFAQLDWHAATMNAGQMACVWADMGATSGTATDVTGLRMFAGTNTTTATAFSMIYLYGKATNLLQLDGSSSTYISAGAATPSGDMKKLAITIDGVTHYILAAAVWS